MISICSCGKKTNYKTHIRGFGYANVIAKVRATFFLILLVSYSSLAVEVLFLPSSLPAGSFSDLVQLHYACLL